MDFMLEVLVAAVEAGATTLNIPDTVGYGIPWDFGALLQHIRKQVPGDYILSTHCHNDLGLATANTLAGVQAGARQVEVCVNGLGERAGNAALEEVVMALKIRSDQFPGVTTTVRTEELARASRLVARLTGYPVQYNKAVVGRNAFAHESGIHQHGVLADRSTYEIIDAATVGQVGRQIVLGKHSGRHAFADTLEKMGIHIQGDGLEPGLRPLQGVRRPQGRDHRGRSRGHRGRGARPGSGGGVPARGARGGRWHGWHATGPRGGQQVRGQGRGVGRGQRHDRRSVHGHPIGDRGRVQAHRVQRVLGDRRRGRARRRRRPARGRRAEGVGPRACPPTWSRRQRGPTWPPSTASCASGPATRSARSRSDRDHPAVRSVGGLHRPSHRRRAFGQVTGSAGQQDSQVVGCGLAQWLHFLAARGRPSERHSGQVLVSAGGPKTVVPRLAMYER